MTHPPQQHRSNAPVYLGLTALALSVAACQIDASEEDGYRFGDAPVRLSEMTAPADFDWRVHQGVQALVRIDPERVAAHGGALLEVREMSGALIYQGPISAQGEATPRFAAGTHLQEVALTVKVGEQVLDEATVRLGRDGQLLHHF